MDRISTRGTSVAKPAIKAPVATPGYFTDGDPTTGIPATVVGPDWLNAVQEEILNVIIAAGLVPNLNDLTQLQQALAKLGRNKLTAPLTLYVSPTGRDTNDGMSSTTPFQTLQHAWDLLYFQYDINHQTVTIKCADGTYSAALQCYGMPNGAAASGINLVGNVTTPANCIVSVANTNAILAANGTAITVGGFRLVASGAGGNGLQSSTNSIVVCTAGMEFGPCGGSQISCNNATLYVQAPVKITGGGTQCIQGAYGAVMDISGQPFTITGNPAYSVAWAWISTNAYFKALGNAFAGGTSTTGPRYYASMNGIIDTGNAGESYLPGNANGVKVSNGQYL